nr:hypothetical protein BaRGS_012013 [Batillaria attramentaria]
MASSSGCENDRTPKRIRFENHEEEDEEDESEDEEDLEFRDFLADQPFREDWQTLTTDEVVEELNKAGFDEDVTKKFKEHNIDGSILDRITLDQLEEGLGITKKTTQKKIEQFLKRIGCYPTMVWTKVFNDPVHGHMEFHPLCVAIIDTPQFQRLRYLKQLGACYFVFPGAAHNRFEHCLGVCHLAGKLMKAIQKRQPNLKITEVDILCVQIAGLCRGLGHGPFSHQVFGSNFLPAVRDDLTEPWEHDDTSLNMYHYMVEDNNLEDKFAEYGLKEMDRTFIAELIKGRHSDESSNKYGDWPYKGRGRDKAFLYEIVANERNGIGVDKWDNLLRDCHHLGMRSSFDHTRFMHFARVIKVGDQMQICVRDKEVFDMYEMFHTHHAVNIRAYRHKVVQSVKIMLGEALVLANDFIRIPGANGRMYKMSECIDHMDAYIHLTDHVFHQIMLSDSQEAGMVKAREILHKIQCRKLYKCIGESVPMKETTATNLEKIRADILQAVPADHRQKLHLTNNHLRVQLVSMNFGLKDKNPLEDLQFYSKNDMKKAKPVKAEEVSMMAVPQNQFKEHRVRIYFVPSDDDTTSAGLDAERIGKLRKACRDWCKEHIKAKEKSHKDKDL